MAPRGASETAARATRRWAKLAVASSLLALSTLAYLLFAPDQTEVALIPVAVASFGAGLYLLADSVTFLSPIKRAVPLIAAAVPAEWLFFNNGWTNYVYNSFFGQLLTSLTSQMSVALLNLAGTRATLASNVILLPAGSKVSAVSVTTACSGAEGALVFLALASLMAVDVGRQAPKKKLLALIALGAVGVTLGNMLRVPLLIEVGYYFGAGAMEAFHLYSGAIIFLTFVGAFFFASLRNLSRPSMTPKG
jgi:exosortase/archaeosortase family protein